MATSSPPFCSTCLAFRTEIKRLHFSFLCEALCKKRHAYKRVIRHLFCLSPRICSITFLRVKRIESFAGFLSIRANSLMSSLDFSTFTCKKEKDLNTEWRRGIFAGVFLLDVLALLLNDLWLSDPVSSSPAHQHHTFACSG